MRIFAVLQGGLEKEFTDWYDFADYIKQENLRGVCVSIFRWEYRE